MDDVAEGLGNNSWFKKKYLSDIVKWICFAASLIIVIMLGLPGNDMDGGHYLAWAILMLILAVAFLFMVLAERGERRHDN